jgi:hypothetical protein
MAEEVKKPLKNVMIDLETMSIEKNAAILSIGAVEFDIETKRLGEEFYQNITLSSCVWLGMHRSAATLNWWALDENKAARDTLTKDAVSIELATARFCQWCSGEIIPWSNGATFDIVILENAIKLCNRIVPWRFFNESCYRTFKRMYPEIVIPRQGIKHNALHDAKHQARHLLAILSELHLKETQCQESA